MSEQQQGPQKEKGMHQCLQREGLKLLLAAHWKAGQLFMYILMNISTRTLF